MSDLINREKAIDALWKALYEYEDETEKQFQESEDLDVGDWIGHRIFVQNMSDIDRQTILNLPSVDAVPVRHGKWIKEFENEDGRNLRCSECHMVFYVGKGRDGNFCPNCGARMDAE